MQVLVMIILKYDHGWGNERMPFKEKNWTTNILDHFIDIKILNNYDSQELRPNLQSLGYFLLENWEKPGIIKVKGETYRTSGSMVCEWAEPGEWAPEQI